jgi:hypothetical protein
MAATGSAPLTPEEIGLLDHLLRNADGADFKGMAVDAGEDDAELFAVKSRAFSDFQTEMAAANGNEKAAQRALDKLNKTMALLETEHAGRISASGLLARAYLGALSPAEIGALRIWMGEQAESQGLACNGYTDCLATAGMRFVQDIARDPVGFFGPFIAPYLYHRLFLKNVFARRLAGVCGGPSADSGEAYRQYEKYVRDEARKSWQGLSRRALQNPIVGAAAFFGIHNAFFSDTDSLALDVCLSVAAFESFETYDALLNPLLQEFAAKNGLCLPRSEPQPAEEPVVADEPACGPEFVSVPMEAPSYEMAFNDGDFECNALDNDCDAETEYGGSELSLGKVGWGVLAVGAAIATVPALLCPVDGPAGEYATASTAVYTFSQL